MKLISNTPIDIIEAAKELDISARQLMKTPADILYYVDPETSIVTVGSKFTVEAIKSFQIKKNMIAHSHIFIIEEREILYLLLLSTWGLKCFLCTIQFKTSHIRTKHK